MATENKINITNNNNDVDQKFFSIEKEAIIKFIDKKCFYNNLFLFLKIKYLITKYQSEKNKYDHLKIPIHLLYIFNDNKNRKKLTFEYISGGVNNDNNDFKKYMENLIIIPKDIIVNYFLREDTRCYRENTYVKNKLDLYFSILTYIYFYTHFPENSYTEEFHNEMMAFIKIIIKHYDNKEEIVDSIYNSTLYDFRNIPNDIKDFMYEFSDIQIHSIQFYNCYNNNYIVDINLVQLYSNFVAHHIITIFRFYKEYILSYFIINKLFKYMNHPLQGTKKFIDE